MGLVRLSLDELPSLHHPYPIMAERFGASVQYDDLKGTAAMDGADSPPLIMMAKRTDMPSGYFPVGFRLFRIHPDENGMIQFQIVAVKTDQTGATMDDIVKYAQSHPDVPVYSFDGEASAQEFGAYFKRVEIAVLNKLVAPYKVMVQPSK